MVQLGRLGAGDIRHLPLAERRQDDLAEQPAVFGRRATLALCFGMLGKEALGEFGDRRRSVGPSCRRPGPPRLDHAEQRLASLRAVSGVQGEPCRPIVSLRSGAPRPPPAR